MALVLADVLAPVYGGAGSPLVIVLRQQRLGYQRLFLVEIGCRNQCSYVSPFSCFSCHFTIFFSACRMISSKRLSVHVDALERRG